MTLLLASTQKLRGQEFNDPCGTVDEKGLLVLKKATYSDVEALCKCDITALHLLKYRANNLPPCIGTMKQLRQLKIENSAIQSFPVALLQMEGLESLSIAFSSVAVLPDDMWRMEGLRELNLRGTAISVLPEGLDFLEMIDMRMIALSKVEQNQLREQYPQAAIYFSAPCKCL